MTNEEAERVRTAIEESVRLGIITFLQGAQELVKLAREQATERTETNEEEQPRQSDRG